MSNAMEEKRVDRRRFPSMAGLIGAELAGAGLVLGEGAAPTQTQGSGCAPNRTICRGFNREIRQHLTGELAKG